MFLICAEMPSGPEMSNFYNIREENASGHRVNRDIDTINASYDRYLRAAVCLSAFWSHILFLLLRFPAALGFSTNAQSDAIY